MPAVALTMTHSTDRRRDASPRKGPAVVPVESTSSAIAQPEYAGCLVAALAEECAALLKQSSSINMDPNENPGGEHVVHELEDRIDVLRDAVAVLPIASPTGALFALANIVDAFSDLTDFEHDEAETRRLEHRVYRLTANVARWIEKSNGIETRKALPETLRLYHSKWAPEMFR